MLNQISLRWRLLALGLVVGIGCRSERAEPPAKGPMKQPAQVVKTITVQGFDPEGEPEIREMSDGTLAIVLNFMPPSYVEDAPGNSLGAFENFDKELEKAAGAPVQWDDREVFLIAKPHADTPAKVKVFLESYRKKK
jgi:hypothetical protein